MHTCATWGSHASSSRLNFLMRHGDDRTQFPDSWEDSVVVPDATQASTQTSRHPNGGGALFSLAPCRRAVGDGAFPRRVTLPSPPPEHSLSQKAYPNVAPGLTQLISLPHRTQRRGLQSQLTTLAPRMGTPPRKASCGLHALSSPSPSRTVPASVKSRPS